MSIFDRDKKTTTPPVSPAPKSVPQEAESSPRILPHTSPQGQTVIGPKVSIKGEITANEPIRIEGSVEGDIHSQEAVYIGAQGTVTADVRAKEIQVLGKVTGNLQASGKIHLGGHARVEGDVTTPRLVVEENAFILGRITMIDQEKKQKTPSSPSPESKSNKPIQSH